MCAIVHNPSAACSARHAPTRARQTRARTVALVNSRAPRLSAFVLRRTRALCVKYAPSIRTRARQVRVRTVAPVNCRPTISATSVAVRHSISA